ncbi:hypothetical protein HDU93_000367 [Gonapodya sp. JEL0774]|nr:hypothetical protein HDU93_000367 [Gonapodya sp. JEL0774]
MNSENRNPGLGAAIRSANAEEAMRPARGLHGPVEAADAARKADRSGVLQDRDSGAAVSKGAGMVLGERGLDAYSQVGICWLRHWILSLSKATFNRINSVRNAAYQSLKAHTEEKAAGTAEMSRSAAQQPNSTTMTNMGKGTQPDQTMTTVRQPPENRTATEQAAGTLAKVSSEADPWPHFGLAGACGAGAWYANTLRSNRNAAYVMGGLGLAYTYAGYLLSSGRNRDVRFGYDVAAFTSGILTAYTAPRAFSARAPDAIVLAALGGVSSLGNLNKSYQMRTGKPKDAQVYAA